MNIEHGLEQFAHAAQELGQERVIRQTLVVLERINSPGYSGRNRILHLDEEPAVVAGKQVHVVFTTQG